MRGFPGALLALVLVLLSVSLARAGCAQESFEGNSYAVCRFDLRQDRLQLFSLDANGQPYGSFSALADALEDRGQLLAFAMNAGMYDDGLKPIGLYVERGKQAKKINRRDGPGNFHLKPNGVFYIKGDKGGVMETEAFLKSGIRPDHASQSGPMLVIDGAIHPKFSEDGQSRQRRNGVGSPDGHTLVFVISESWVNFHSFARLFRNRLGCKNALFLDGSISSIYAPELGRRDGFFPLGPIVALVK
ncbi:phosphodiester glycosidase family protein [Aestuariivirga sp.]|uniref:phosphodiester glycosidase family protein n=1 Tax=Aestuariivirga sp. TaxID=2650926 RepID=UPI0035945EF0